jgi:hypothetical protein
MKKMSVKVLLFAVVLTSLASVAAFADEYKFKVTNNTKTVITKGIKPGATVELVWDKSTNNEACKQHVKAVYADGSESEPAMFDFCESDVALEFGD